MYLGDFTPTSVVRGYWNSNAVAGGSITRATNGTISVYKDGNTTQSTAGVTDTEDFDTLTGVHLVAIDTSADGTFYSAGSDFAVVLSAATIDGVTINAFLFGFSLHNRSHLRPTTAGRTLDVSSGGEAGIDWANVGSPTTTVALSGTTVKTATDVETDTQDIQSRLPSALVSGRIDASVGAMASGVVTATAIAADAIGASELAADAVAEIQSGLATASALSTAQADLDDIQTRLPAALVSGRIDASVGAVATGAIDAGAIAADAIGSSELAASAASEIATAVRSELTTELGRIDAAVSTRASQASVDTVDDFLDTEIAAIKAKTDALPTDPADASDIAASFSTVNGTLTTIAGYIDTEVAAIKAKTDTLPASPAAVGSAMTLDLTQTVSDVGGAANTLGGVLGLLRAMANGKMTIVSGVLKLFGQDNTTQVGVDRTITGTVPTDTTRA